MAPSNFTVDAGIVFGFIAMLVNILRPYVEELPFGKPGSATHDSTLMLLNGMLNFLAILVIAIATHQVTSAGDVLTQLPVLIYNTLLAAGGSHFVYTLSVNAKQKSSAKQSPQSNL